MENFKWNKTKIITAGFGKTSGIVAELDGVLKKAFNNNPNHDYFYYVRVRAALRR